MEKGGAKVKTDTLERKERNNFDETDSSSYHDSDLDLWCFGKLRRSKRGKRAKNPADADKREVYPTIETSAPSWDSIEANKKSQKSQKQRIEDTSRSASEADLKLYRELRKKQKVDKSEDKISVAASYKTVSEADGKYVQVTENDIYRDMQRQEKTNNDDGKLSNAPSARTVSAVPTAMSLKSNKSRAQLEQTTNNVPPIGSYPETRVQEQQKAREQQTTTNVSPANIRSTSLEKDQQNDDQTKPKRRSLSSLLWFKRESQVEPKEDKQKDDGPECARPVVVKAAKEPEDTNQSKRQTIDSIFSVKKEPPSSISSEQKRTIIHSDKDAEQSRPQKSRLNQNATDSEKPTPSDKDQTKKRSFGSMFAAIKKRRSKDSSSSESEFSSATDGRTKAKKEGKRRTFGSLFSGKGKRQSKEYSESDIEKDGEQTKTKRRTLGSMFSRKKKSLSKEEQAVSQKRVKKNDAQTQKDYLSPIDEDYNEFVADLEREKKAKAKEPTAEAQRRKVNDAQKENEKDPQKIIRAPFGVMAPSGAIPPDKSKEGMPTPGVRSETDKTSYAASSTMIKVERISDPPRKPFGIINEEAQSSKSSGSASTRPIIAQVDGPLRQTIKRESSHLDTQRDKKPLSTGQQQPTVLNQAYPAMQMAGLTSTAVKKEPLSEPEKPSTSAYQQAKTEPVSKAVSRASILKHESQYEGSKGKPSTDKPDSQKIKTEPSDKFDGSTDKKVADKPESQALKTQASFKAEGLKGKSSADQPDTQAMKTEEDRKTKVQGKPAEQSREERSYYRFSPFQPVPAAMQPISNIKQERHLESEKGVKPTANQQLTESNTKPSPTEKLSPKQGMAVKPEMQSIKSEKQAPAEKVAPIYDQKPTVAKSQLDYQKPCVSSKLNRMTQTDPIEADGDSVQRPQQALERSIGTQVDLECTDYINPSDKILAPSGAALKQNSTSKYVQTDCVCNNDSSIERMNYMERLRAARTGSRKQNKAVQTDFCMCNYVSSSDDDLEL